MRARLDLTQPELRQLLHIISCYPPRLRIEQTHSLRLKIQLAGLRLGERQSKSRGIHNDDKL